MGSNKWCRNCSETRNHVGMAGNTWDVQDSGNLVWRCTACGHLRTTDEVELSAGTTIENSIDGSTKTLQRDGFLSGWDGSPGTNAGDSP